MRKKNVENVRITKMIFATEKLQHQADRTQNREVALDVIRALAAFCVVVNHSVEALFPLDAEFVGQAAPATKWLMFMAFTFGRTGVPLFFLLSGYLLLPRTYDETRIKRFYTHNFLPLLVVWEIWILLYSIFLTWYNATGFNLRQYLFRALFLEHAGLPHTWYMPVILSIYLFLPFVAIALHRMPGKLLAGLLLATYVYLYIVPAANMMLQLYRPDWSVYAQADLSYSGGVYGFYLVLGYVIARYRVQIKQWLIKPVLRLAVVGCTFLLFVGTALVQIFMYEHGAPYNVWYSYFTLPLLGCCVFLLLYTVKIPRRIQSTAAVLSRNSFGIYLIHEPILMILTRGAMGNALKLAVLSFGIYVVSFALVWGLSLIPHVGRIFMQK